MKIKDKLRSAFEIKNLITANIVAWSVFYLIKRCNVSLYRLINAFKDLGLSLYFWFLDTRATLSGSSVAPSVNVTVNDIPPIDIQQYIPIDLDEFVYRLSRLHIEFIDMDNFREFNLEFFFLFYKVTLFGMLFAFIFIFAGFIIHDLLTSENEKENGYVTESYMKLVNFFYSKIKPVVLCIRDYFVHLLGLSGVVFALVVIWLTAFNVFTIAVEFFAYYFFFLASFDTLSLFVQLYKLVLDVAIMLDSAPLIVWIVLVAAIYSICAVITGLDRLRHGEAKNCGVVKALNLIILLWGEMGLGKTAVGTDIALSCNNIHKQEANEIMFKYDMIFPEFSWEFFETDLQAKISDGTVYNIPMVKKHVETLERYYKAFPGLFAREYNFDRRMEIVKNIGTHEISLFDAMYEYGKAFFVYTCDNPNLANYSIRLDGYHDDSPYFKKWCGDFFKPDKSKSKYCHILDQDIMRLGKLVDPENKQAGSFGYGIYNNTEWGKSRLNQVNSEGIKKDAEETNQKNDLYDYLVKLVRHASVMIDNKVFFKFIADEQRPESIPASLRDVVTVVNIVSKSELKNALPGFWLMDLIYDKVYEPIKSIYYDYRNKRGDRTAATLVLKAIVSAFSNFYLIAYNNFGYYDLELDTESGRAYGNNGEPSNSSRRYTYQLAVKKIYSERYSTDCYQQFFEKKQLESSFGINNYPCYSDLKMNVEEMKQQHDYFLMEIMDIMLGEKEASEAPVMKKEKKKQKSDSEIFSNLQFERL